MIKVTFDEAARWCRISEYALSQAVCAKRAPQPGRENEEVYFWRREISEFRDALIAETAKPKTPKQKGKTRIVRGAAVTTT